MDEPDETKPLLGDAYRPRFAVQAAIALRESPKLDAKRTGEVLSVGETIVAHDIVTAYGDEVNHWDHAPLDATCFIDIGDGRGWAINRNLMDETFLLEQIQDDETFMGTLRFKLRSAFQTRTYEMIIASIIILNALAIWAEIDYSHSMPSWFWALTNSAWGIIYVVEISLKIFAFGQHFADSNWNIFDFVVTFVTITSDIAPLLFNGDSFDSLNQLAPIMRLLRLLRLANVFRGLKTLMHSFTTSLSALGWIAVFLVIWFFISGCLTTVLIGRKEWFPDSAAPNAAQLRAKFNTVPYSMYTLFEVMSMEGWTDVVRPISRTRPLLVLFFFVFIFISGFFLLNLVTAVVVDRTVQAQEEDEARKEETHDDENEKTIFDVMQKLQARNKGMDVVSRKDLSKWLKDDSDVSVWLKKVEWDPELADRACSVIDRNNTGTVSLSELGHEISSTSEPLDKMALIRMQAEMSTRMERQEQLLQRILSGDLRPAGQR